MQPVPPDTDNSPAGEVPGSPGVPAFTLSASEPSAIPVLIAAPHAGRAYPASLLAAMRSPGFSTLRLEDRLADQLGQAVARATGAALLVAHAPRAMIDLNRAPDDIDWEMVEGGPADAPNGHGFGRRARTGLGLIPRRLPGLGELWKRRLPLAEMEARIATVHAPYHAVLADALGRLRERWGAALLIDLHIDATAGGARSGTGCADRAGRPIRRRQPWSTGGRGVRPFSRQRFRCCAQPALCRRVRAGTPRATRIAASTRSSSRWTGRHILIRRTRRAGRGLRGDGGGAGRAGCAAGRRSRGIGSGNPGIALDRGCR